MYEVVTVFYMFFKAVIDYPVKGSKHWPSLELQTDQNGCWLDIEGRQADHSV